MKFQSYPKSTNIDAFERKIGTCRNTAYLTLDSKKKKIDWFIITWKLLSIPLNFHVCHHHHNFVVILHELLRHVTDEKLWNFSQCFEISFQKKVEIHVVIFMSVTREVYCFPRCLLIFSFDRHVIYHSKGLWEYIPKSNRLSVPRSSNE